MKEEKEPKGVRILRDCLALYGVCWILDYFKVQEYLTLVLVIWFAIRLRINFKKDYPNETECKRAESESLHQTRR